MKETRVKFVGLPKVEELVHTTFTTKFEERWRHLLRAHDGYLPSGRVGTVFGGNRLFLSMVCPNFTSFKFYILRIKFWWV